MKLRPLSTCWSRVRRPVRFALPVAAAAFSLLGAVASADTPTGMGKLPLGADAEALSLISAQKAHQLGFTGAGTSVVVLDSGVRWSDPAFGCTQVNEPARVCRIVLSADMNKNDQQDDAKHGHGTNVSGIVAAVAPGTQLIVLDVFEKGENATDRAILGALNWVLINRKQYNIVAVNMSLGAPLGFNKKDCDRNNQYTSAFNQLRSAGIVPVVAAGNQGMIFGRFVNGISVPACTPGGVSVGAVYKATAGKKVYEATCTDDTRRPDQVTCFSQSGPNLGMLAPGADIKAAGITMTGTSQAAPHVAGAVAALASKCKTATDEQLIQVLTTSGPRITDSRNNVSKVRLDVLAAGQVLQKQGLCS